MFALHFFALLFAHDKITSKENGERGQGKDVHLHILGQRRLREKPKYGWPRIDAQREKEFGMTYISCAQNLAKIYPTVFGS